MRGQPIGCPRMTFRVGAETGGVQGVGNQRVVLRRLGWRLCALRERAGLTQEELGELADLHRTYVGSVERGERNLRLANLLKLADVLGVDPGGLVEGLPYG